VSASIPPVAPGVIHI